MGVLEAVMNSEGGGPAQAPGLHLRFFGTFEAHRGGTPLPRTRTRKEGWLLALLALRHGQAVDRSWLAGSLWPDSTEERALAYLRSSLYDLRRVLGPDAVRLSAPSPRSVCLDLTGASADLVEFDRAIERGDVASLRRAVANYRGPLLEGCAEEWVMPEREARHQAYLAALAKIASAALDAGDPATAVRHLSLLIAADALRESAHRALMQALAGCGDHAAAVRSYRDLRLLLHQELNAEPAPETRALFERIRAEGRQRTSGSVGVWTHGGEGERPSTRAHPDTRLGGRLPRPLSSLVGREHDVREVLARLACSQLVTLTGTGGVGKTRLAIQVAEELGSQPADTPPHLSERWFVELAALSDPSMVPLAVASALGLREAPSRALIDTLVDHLQASPALLVLDNCEHLVEACARLAERLLGDCPGLRILATSREALGIPGETVWQVPPLPVPHPESLRPAGKRTAPVLLGYGAVRLFVERALAVQPKFALSGEHLQAVAHVCHSLDGIPLAIELAAARVKALSVEGIASLLAREHLRPEQHPASALPSARFRLLTGGSRTALPRHQTLRAALDWSYDLLREPEQLLLRRLSVFAGGWTLEAAEAVCGSRCPRSGRREVESWSDDVPVRSTPTLQHSNTPPLPSADVLDLLTSLVDKSLVLYEADEERYRLLESIRQYAADRLQESDEAAAARRRHLDFFLRWTEMAEAPLSAAGSGTTVRGSPGEADRWLERLDRERDNLRAALEWSLASDESAESALRLAAAARRLWVARDYFKEGRIWVERVLAASAGTASVLRGELLATAAWIALRQDDYPAAHRWAEESAAIWRQMGNRERLADTLHVLGSVLAQWGDLSGARAVFEESLSLQQGGSLGGRISESLNNLGMALLRQGDLGAARPIFERALAAAREAGDTGRIAVSLLNLGHSARIEGDRTGACARYEECIAVGREHRYASFINYARADLGLVLLKRGEYAAAREAIVESLRTWREMGNQYGVIRSLEGLAQLGWACRQPARAARLFGAAEAQREAIQAPLAPVDRPDYECVPALRAALGEESLVTAWAEGRRFSLEQAIAFALEETPAG